MGIIAQTFNFYLGALKQFCLWRVKDRRARGNPVAHLGDVNTKVDRRHDRRALSVEEIRRMLEVTFDDTEVMGFSGPDRTRLYPLALVTGLRVRELRSSTWASFSMDGSEPTVTVAAAYAKGKRTDSLPLQAETVGLLRAHLASKTPTAPAFWMPSRMADMLKVNLAAAGINYRADDLVFDFHAFSTAALHLLKLEGEVSRCVF